MNCFYFHGMGTGQDQAKQEASILGCKHFYPYDYSAQNTILSMRQQMVDWLSPQVVNLSSVVLVGHSLGGLCLRFVVPALQELFPWLYCCLITLGSPSTNDT